MADDPVRMLYKYLDERLTLNEFVELCRMLGVDEQNIAGDTRRMKLLELQKYAERRGRLAELILTVAELRPDLDLTPYGGPPPSAPPRPAPAPPPATPPAATPPPPRLPYQDFDLYVQAAGEGRYTVEVTRSPAGQSPRVPREGLPLADEQGQQWLAELRAGLLTLPDAEAMGRLLYAWLFPEPIAATLGAARAAQRYLRLRLRLDPPEVSLLPWEFIFHPTDGFLALNRELPLVRYSAEFFGSRFARPAEGLRLLAAAASPADSSWSPLDVEAELRQLRDSLAGVPGLQLRELPHVTRGALQEALIQGVDVLHFIGHGTQAASGAGTRVSRLIFEGEEGEPVEEISAEMLRVLIQGRGIRLVMLNACKSAQSESPASMGLAPALVRAQVPAVVAMQGALSERAAQRFAHLMYRMVAQGQALDTAVAEMRVSLYDGQGTEWGLPVLFLRDFDGILWEAPPAAQRASEAPSRGGVTFSDIHGSSISIGGSVVGGDLIQGG